MRGEFVHKISIRHEFSGLLIFGVKGIFDELESIVEILVHELQAIEEIRVDDVQFSDEDIKFLEVDGPFAVGNPLESLHQVLLCYRCIQHVVSLCVDKEFADCHGGSIFF